MEVLKQKIKSFLVDCYVVLCRLVFGMKDRVLFVSFSGGSYSDNPKPVSEKLHELAPEIEIIWLFKDPEKKKTIVPEYVNCVDINNKYQLMAQMAISKCIVNNCTFSWIKKGRKQFFIQLWHGDRAFKKVLYDSSFSTTDFSVAESKPGYCDLAVAGSDYGEQQYRSAFRYEGEVLKVGTPRNDMLLRIDESKIKQIKDTLNISGEKKIALYAPTLRRENAENNTLQPKQDIDLVKTLSVLNASTHKQWIFLVRAHPSVSGMSGISENANIIDVSAYEDMADLLLISDLLITDYSSSAGDYALLHRPLVLFQSDYDAYVEKDRGFYFNMEDSPYYIAKSQEELESVLTAMTSESVIKNCDDILAFYGTNETGKASEAVAKRIINWIRQGER